MSTALDACTCGSIGAPKEIRLCAEHHRYWLGDRRMASVSSVINRMLPTDWSGIPPEVLENARIRGVLVDQYFCEYLRTGNVTVPAGERQDVKDRLNMLIPWWDKNGMPVKFIQRTVYSEADGVAGMLDLGVEDGVYDTVLDLKCVSSLQKSYALQLGAYLSYGGFDEAGIIHVTKDRVRLVNYHPAECVRQWRAIVEAWKVVQELKPDA